LLEIARAFLSKKSNMMKETKYEFSYKLYADIADLDKEDALLLAEAREKTKVAYAPYSKFLVGAVAKLNNGEIVSGTNQENASYPAGLCAERVLMSTASSLFPNVPIETMAISYHNVNGKSGHPISPCGVCRQSLQEFAERTKQSIRIILGGQDGEVLVIDNASNLLPLAFSSKELL
jgi:cytidine deaminase